MLNALFAFVGTLFVGATLQIAEAAWLEPINFMIFQVKRTASAPVNTALPAVSPSSPIVGTSETSSLGTWVNSPASYTCQWKWNDTGAAISGASSCSSYTPVTGDVTHTLAITVTATNTSGSASATSLATSAVTAPSTTFPDATNTGVPAGTTLTAYTGPTTITTAGTIIDSADISGMITIAANNVTIKNSRIRSSDYHGININDGVTGAIIQDTEVDGLGAAGNCIRSASSTILRVYAHNSIDGVDITGSNVIIQDSFFTGFVAPTGAEHIDPITDDGGNSNILIKHVHIYLASADHTTAGLTVTPFWNPVHNVTIRDSLIEGGTYVLRMDQGSAGTENTGNQLINNALHLTSGTIAYGKIDAGTTTLVSGNYDYITNANIDGQL